MGAGIRLAAAWATALAALALAPAHAHELARCGGISPVQNACTSTFLAPGGGLAITTAATPGFIGWVHARVESSAGSWTEVSCAYAGLPQPPECTLDGWGPPYNAYEPVVLSGWVTGPFDTRASGVGQWSVGVAD